MLIDITLAPSRMQQGIQVLGLLVLAILVWFSALPWPLVIMLIGVLLGLNWWLGTMALAGRIAALWQGDSHSWYWQDHQGRRHSGQLLAVRHLGLVIHLTFTTARQQCVFIPIWRDQVNESQWRHLCVLHALKDSQQNWL